MCVCLCAHTHMWVHAHMGGGRGMNVHMYAYQVKARSQPCMWVLRNHSPCFSEQGFSLSWSSLSNSRDVLASISPMLKLQAWATIPIFHIDSEDQTQYLNTELSPAQIVLISLTVMASLYET